MLPSKIRPTSSPFLLTTADPLLPPTMSFVLTKLKGVFGLSAAFAATHAGARA